MIIDKNFQFSASISEENFIDKDTADMMIGTYKVYKEERLKKFGHRRGISFKEQTTTPSELLNKLINGHGFCHCFNPEYPRKDGTFGAAEKKYENFKSSHVIGVDIDHITKYEEISDFIGKLTLKPTFWYTTYSNRESGKGLRFRMVYVILEEINHIYLFKYAATKLNKMIMDETGEIIDECNLQATQYFNGTNVNNPNLNIEYDITNTIYSLADFGVSEKGFIKFLCDKAGYKNVYGQRRFRITNILNSWTTQKEEYIYNSFKKVFQKVEYKKSDWYRREKSPYEFPELNNQKYNGGLLDFNTDVQNSKPEISEVKSEYVITKIYEPEQTDNLNSNIVLSIQTNSEIKSETLKSFETLNTSTSNIEPLNSNLDKSAELLNVKMSAPLTAEGGDVEQHVNYGGEKGDGTFFFDVCPAISPIDFEFDIVLYKWDRFSIDIFRNSKEWIRCLTYKEYIYRSLNDWNDNRWQFINDDYFRFCYVNRTVKDGEHRRKKLFMRMCLRRVMAPWLTEEDLMFNTIVDIIMFFDNSDRALDSAFIRTNVKNAMSYSIFEIEKMYAPVIKFLRNNTKPKKRIIYNGKESVSKETTYLIIDRFYNSELSVNENYENIKNYISYTKKTIYEYAKARGYKTDPNKLTDEELYDIIDITATVEKNIGYIKALNKKIKKDRVAKVLKQKREDYINNTPDIVSEPYVEYGRPIEEIIDEIFNMPLWMAQDKYGFDFRSEGVYLYGKLVATWEELEAVDVDDDSEDEVYSDYDYGPPVFIT